MEPTQPTPPTAPQNLAEDPNLSEQDPETAEEIQVKLDTTPKNYYQAIGWLRGKITKVEDRFQIQIKDSLFPLYLPRRVMAVANHHLEQIVWIKCYPQSKGEGLSFKAVWMGTEQLEKGEPGIFVLRGIWQFIPQCRRPVFTIYRNELKNYENRPSNQHLPLIWADQPPYRFRKDSEEKPKFCQIMARLIPQRACFGFVSQIAEPQDVAPRRVKKPPMEGGAGNKTYSKSKEKAAESTGEQTTQETNPETKAERPPKPQKKIKSDSKTPAQAEVPVEISSEVPTDMPTATPGEPTAETTIIPPVQEAVASPVETPPEVPVELPVEIQSEAQAEPTLETPAETPPTAKTKGKSKAKSKSKSKPDSAS